MVMHALIGVSHDSAVSHEPEMEPGMLILEVEPTYLHPIEYKWLISPSIHQYFDYVYIYILTLTYNIYIYYKTSLYKLSMYEQTMATTTASTATAPHSVLWSFTYSPPMPTGSVTLYSSTTTSLTVAKGRGRIRGEVIINISPSGLL